MRIFSLLFLVACLGPDVRDDCVSNQVAEFDACEIDLDANAREDIAEVCAQAAGYARGIGCASEAQKLEKCRAEVFSLSPDCADLDEDLDICSYEQGLLNGCLDR